jgi:hypothetical protein
MDNQILFTEKQKFNQWWLWLIIVSINIFFLFSVYKQVFLGESIGDNPMSNVGRLVLLSLVMLLFSGLFFILRLDTIIDKKGVYVRFYPIRKTYKLYLWDKIKKLEIRQYKALLEYGGWGIRIGNGKALTVSGNIGLQIVFKDKRKLLIGTQKSIELERIIESYIKGKLKL